MSTRMRRLHGMVAVLGLAFFLLQVGPGIPGHGQVAVGAAPGVLGGCGDGTCGFVVK